MAATFEQFKGALASNDLAKAQKLLSQLKIELTKQSFLQPTAATPEQFALARDVLEHAVVLSVKAQDSEGVGRHVAQLDAYYSTTKSSVPDSPKRLLITGLNLLRLLAHTRLEEFHTRLELLAPAELDNQFVKHPLELEQWLMEGSYGRVFAARDTAPDPLYKYYMDVLQSTIRSEIASCAERVYEALKVGDAQQLLRLQSAAEAHEFGTARGWALDATDGGVFRLRSDVKEKPSVPSMQLIQRTLNYAKELERIV